MNEFEKFIEAVKRGALEDVRAIAQSSPEFLNRKDETGAAALHYAAIGGHRAVVRLMVECGADINVTDSEYGATPAGWAIEYLREMGGFLAIELDDFAFAIGTGDVAWVKRFLARFPGLRGARDSHGKSFRMLVGESGNPEIVRLFESDAA
jgi:ankyrin repeat protein